VGPREASKEEAEGKSNQGGWDPQQTRRRKSRKGYRKEKLADKLSGCGGKSAKGRRETEGEQRCRSVCAPGRLGASTLTPAAAGDTIWTTRGGRAMILSTSLYAWYLLTGVVKPQAVQR